MFMKMQFENDVNINYKNVKVNYLYHYKKCLSPNHGPSNLTILQFFLQKLTNYFYN